MYTIPENSINGSRKKLESCREIAQAKGFSVILRIPKIREGEMKANHVFSGTKSARSIQNDQKTCFLVSAPPRIAWLSRLFSSADIYEEHLAQNSGGGGHISFQMWKKLLKIFRFVRIRLRRYQKWSRTLSNSFW